MRYRCIAALMQYAQRFFYIRFYGGHLYIRPLYLERKLHLHAANHIKFLKEKYGDRRCFVIGNGPSLNQIDMTKLKSEITIGSNGIYMNYSKMGFYPTFMTVVNYLIAEQMGEEIASISDSIFIFPSFLRPYFKDCKGQTLYLNADSGFKASDDVTRWISWQSTVTFFNLQIAFSLGFPDVYLIGVDNSYQTPAGGHDGKVIVQKDSRDANHFTANYFKEGFLWQQADTQNMEKCYKIIDKLYEDSKKRIYNATAGGNLEIFQRIDYDSLF